jgi:hypothetical protein
MEVDQLYKVPHILIKGLNLAVEEGNKAELCKDCMWKLIKIINNFHKDGEDE